jgi:hypothetical protein
MKQRKRKDRTIEIAVILAILLYLFGVLSGALLARAEDVPPVNEISAQPISETNEISVQPILTEDEILVLPISAAPTEPIPLPAETEAETDPPPEINARYASLVLTQEDIDLLAAITYLEAGNQSPEGQQAVVEVVLNRVIADNFPDTVHDVLYQPGQFSPAAQIAYTQPTEAQYAAVDAALYGTSILPADVVYFSRSGENANVFAKIGDHVFCYQYTWD